MYDAGMRPLLVFLGLVAVVSFARADYREDQQKEKVRQIEYQVNSIKPPAWFDGQKITDASIAPQLVDQFAQKCEAAVKFYDTNLPTLDAKGAADPRLPAVKQKYAELVPYCRAVRAAADQALKNKAEGAQRASADKEKDQAARQKLKAFMDELSEEGKMFLLVYAKYYDGERFKNSDSSASNSPAEIKRAEAGVASLRAACKKYMPMETPSSARPGYIWDYPDDICKMADQGDKIIHASLLSIAMTTVIVARKFLIDDTTKWLETTKDEGLVDDIQERIFDNAKWLDAMNKKFQKHFDGIGEKVPADAWVSAMAKDADVKAKIDQLGTTKSWEQPQNKDGAVEGFVAKEWAKVIPGVKIRKIGTSYPDWAEYDEKTFVGSDEKFNYYKVNKGKNRYKRGWALLEIPGRPYCQAREWIVFRVYTGPVQIDSLGPSGHFMKCK